MRIPGSLSRLLFAGASSCLLLGIAARALCAPIDHDENMYLAAGVLVADHELYRDFAYLQMPYFPHVYSSVFRLTGTTSYLLTGRILAIFFVALAAMLVFFVARRLSGSIGTASWAASSFLFAGPILHVLPFAWNHVLPLMLSLFAFLQFLRGVEGERRGAMSHVIAGISLGLAVGMKLTYAALPPVFLLVAALFPRDVSLVERCKRQLVPLVSGMVFALLPLLPRFLRAGWDRVWFDNVAFHELNTRWRASTGYVEGMSAAGKARVLVEEGRFPATASIAVALVAVGVMVLLARGRRERSDARNRGGAPAAFTLCALLFAASLLASIAPTPLWPSYLAMPVPFAVLFLCALWGRLDGPARRLSRWALAGLALVAFLTGGRVLFRDVPRLLSLEQWTPIAVHRDALAIRHALEIQSALVPGPRIATMAPMYALEAGLPIYPELATGPFLYRVGDLLTEAERERYVGVSASTLGSFLDRDPPAAVLIGTEEDLDETWNEILGSRPFRQVDVPLRRRELRLFVRTR